MFSPALKLFHVKKSILIPAVLLALAGICPADLTLEEQQKLPPPLERKVDFAKDIKPLFEAACIQCHAKGKDKGGLSIETREAFLKGGDTGAAAEPGKSATSLVVEMVSGIHLDNVMPKKGTKWTPEQVGMLRAWIDQGAVWPESVTFAKPPTLNLHPRAVALQGPSEAHPVDQLLDAYFAAKKAAGTGEIKPNQTISSQKISRDAPADTPLPLVDDAVFARRVYLDISGLLPTPEQIKSFLADKSSTKRAELVRTLLSYKRTYADHWLTFWNDLLHNDYKGTGFIDGGRKQISGWLHNALYNNLPYDQFVTQLVNPSDTSEGFTKGIIWRGNVNASMQPPMQAAQNISQVFLGVNLKCASCHDSFVSDWSLADTYGLAAIYSDTKLELVHCDKPTGQQASARFLYPELGTFDGNAAKPERLKRLAEIITGSKDGRLPRTVVNRLWARLLGRGLVEPLDDMEKPAWNPDLLDWLAEDFVSHGYDIKHTIEVICTSKAYQLAAVEMPDEKKEYVFRGPLTRRLTAEQFEDAISELSGDWNKLPSSLEFDFGADDVAGGVQMPKWVWTSEPLELGVQRKAAQDARKELAAAMEKLAQAQKKAEDAAEKGGEAVEETRVAVEAAAEAVVAVEEKLKDAGKPRPVPKVGEQQPTLSASDKHKVVFRQKFTLSQAPATAYGALLATQSAEIKINGKVASSMIGDNTRSNRVELFNFAPLLHEGENVVAISVSSHTSKPGLTDAEKKLHPASQTHLNPVSGLAFYIRCELPGEEPVQITSDETWHVRRAAEGDWGALALKDGDWTSAVTLPPDANPVDEGPGLEPVRRLDFANTPVYLRASLSPAVSTVSHVGQFRASHRAADMLQTALDRPNREIVISSRMNAATTMQALELTNGSTLDAKLKKAAAGFATEAAKYPDGWLERIYWQTLARPPSAAEKQIATEMLGAAPKPEGIADFLWALLNLPEFQLIN